jgi:LysR family cyn operon transcriptional activator
MLLRHIRYLLAVAEHRNFTRAAQALHVSQPALSQQIKQLEESFGASLFDRSGRSVQLTDAGQAYLAHARRALAELDAGERAIHDVQDLSRGSLHLAITPTFTEYLVAPLVERFGARHPGIELTVSEMTLDQIVAELGDDGVDLGIAFSGVAAAEIDSRPLFQERLTLVVGRGHPYAGAGPLAPQQLQGQPLALLTREFATRQSIDAWLAGHGVAPRIMLQANSISSIVKIVRQGRMATLLPDAIARAQPELVCVALAPAPPARTVAMLGRKDGYRSAAAGAFADLLLAMAAEFGPPPEAA